MRSNGPTIPERILLAAAELAEDGKTFTAEQLVVAAWKADRGHFGLQGFADEYPDSNRVLTKIMGSGSVLRQKGWLTKVGSKRYRLTDVGRQEAMRLKGTDHGQSPTRLGELGREHVAALRRMLESSAFAKFSSQQPLTFSDVCAFWNISPRSTAHQLARQKALADQAAEFALKLSSNGEEQGTIVLPGWGAVVSRSDLKALPELAEYIASAFRSELDVIRRRGDERRA